MTNTEKYKTAKEREEAFNNFCNNNVCQKCFDDCMSHAVPCLLKWLDLEAEEEKPLPCPYCGYKYVNVNKEDQSNLWTVSCASCLSASAYNADKDKAIAAYNRVARAVIEAAKEEKQ